MNSTCRADSNPKVARLVTRFVHGNLSAQMTLMYWLKLGRSVEEIEYELAAFTSFSRSGDAAQLSELQQFLQAHREGCQRIAAMVGSGMDTDKPAATIDEGLAFCRRLFDWSSHQSSEASVALYSLGSPALLRDATQEIVSWLRQQGFLSDQFDALEIGCGIGRFEEALAPKLRSIVGIDLSSEMVRQARTRCHGLENVCIRQCDGCGLQDFDDESFDLVLAVDSFPYLHQSGRPLLVRHFEDARRVLRPGGALVVLELSYGRTLEADRLDFAHLAEGSKLQVLIAGEQPFHAWDGIAFVARRSPRAG